MKPAETLPRDAPAVETRVLRAELVSKQFLDMIPRDFARRVLAVSQGEDEEGREVLVVARDTTPTHIHNLGVALGCELAVEVGSGEAIAQVVDEAYGQSERNLDPDLSGVSTSADEIAEVDRLIEKADQDLLSSEGKGPVVQLVDALLFEALSRGASRTCTSSRSTTAPSCATASTACSSPCASFRARSPPRSRAV